MLSGKFELCVFEGALGGGRTSKLSGTPSSVISFSFLPLQPSLTSKSNLLQQHESGLSSSSYELSQYMTEAPEQYEPMVSATWRPIQAGGYQVAVELVNSDKERLGHVGSHPSVLPGIPYWLTQVSPAERPTLDRFPALSLVMVHASDSWLLEGNTAPSHH